MDTVRYVLAVLLVATFPPAVAFWFVVHPFAKQWRTVGTRWAYLLTLGALFAMIAGLVAFRGTLVGRDLGYNLFLILAGLLFYAGSLTVEVFCRRHLTFRILTGVPELSTTDPGKILDQGIYARIRHPRYVGVLLAAVGWSMIANYTGGYVIAVALFPAVYLLTVIEERELLDRFGAEYAAYRERVPRFLPHRRKASPTGSN